MSDYSLLKQLCSIRACAGNEQALRDFLLHFLAENASLWKVQPKVLYGEEFGDAMLWIFGEPRTALYAHLDSVAFMVSYDNYLVPIGSPDYQHGDLLCFEKEGKVFTTKLIVLEAKNNPEGADGLLIDFPEPLPAGTELFYHPIWEETSETISSCYLDNRVGVFTALELCKTLENGAIAFSCYEEIGGGSAGILGAYLLEHYNIRKSLIADVTWKSKGVLHNRGVVLSLRDSRIPRKAFSKLIAGLALTATVKHQFEVELFGGSDGAELQRLPLSIDWFFIGPPIDNMHTPKELLYKADLMESIKLFTFLMDEI